MGYSRWGRKESNTTEGLSTDETTLLKKKEAQFFKNGKFYGTKEWISPTYK